MKNSLFPFQINKYIRILGTVGCSGGGELNQPSSKDGLLIAGKG